MVWVVLLAGSGKLQTIDGILYSQTWTCEATHVGGVVREILELQGMILEVNSAKFMRMHFIILVQLDINDNNFYNIMYV